MKGKKLVIAFSSALCLCVLFAVVVRFSYRQITPEQIRSYSLSSISLTSLIQDYEITGFQDCADEADVILIGTCLGVSAYTDEALYSKIQVGNRTIRGGGSGGNYLGRSDLHQS